jgi:hypothetical protein
MLVSRDSFAREELHRSSIWAYGDTCQWCGNVKTTKTGKKRLYTYWIERDDRNGKRDLIKGKYCSNQCFRDYNY